MKTLSIIVVVFIVSFNCWAKPVSVKVLALFSNKALMLIDGERHLMKQGSVVQGITLISATGRGAVVRFENGKQQTLDINQSIRSSYRKPVNNRLKVFSNSKGMFLVDGKINGKSTRFLVDTGATFIAMSSQEADKLGLVYELGDRGYVQTASDVAPVWRIKLDRVKVGNISVSQVDAVVLEGDKPQPVLLGMSFLQHLKLQRNGAAMVMEQKY